MEVIYENIFYLILLVSNYYVIASEELTLQKENTADASPHKSAGTLSLATKLRFWLCV